MKWKGYMWGAVKWRARSDEQTVGKKAGKEERKTMRIACAKE